MTEKFVYDVPVRWSDMDAFGHVNNARFLTLYEEARCELFFGQAHKHGLDSFEAGTVVARHEIDYVRPVDYGDPLRIELGDLKALAAAFGDQALTVQQMQRVGNRLARYAELLRKLVLANTMPRRQRTVDDSGQNPLVDLVDQVGKRIQRGHKATRLEYGIPNSNVANPWKWSSRAARSPSKSGRTEFQANQSKKKLPGYGRARRGRCC